MNILICDDSALARKSLYRIVSKTCDANIHLCENGQEALDLLSELDIDLMFLDLTMPVMDGYEVLAELSTLNCATKVAVVSGDIQEEAKRRCMEMGAVDFVEKPFKDEQIKLLLINFVCVTECKGVYEPISIDFEIDAVSKFKEITNIALGRCAAVLSNRVGQFIELPVPTVGYVEASELRMILNDSLHRDSVYAATQRFVGGGIHGESLVCIRGKNISEMAEALGFTCAELGKHEQVLNISNLLVSSYLKSLSHQLVKDFSLRQPMMMDIASSEHLIEHQIRDGAFTIEFTYYAESLDFEGEMLLLLDSDSMDVISDMMGRV